jgi:hypothetical protein
VKFSAKYQGNLALAKNIQALIQNFYKEGD